MKLYFTFVKFHLKNRHAQNSQVAAVEAAGLPASGRAVQHLVDLPNMGSDLFVPVPEKSLLLVSNMFYTVQIQLDLFRHRVRTVKCMQKNKLKKMLAKLSPAQFCSPLPFKVPSLQGKQQTGKPPIAGS